MRLTESLLAWLPRFFNRDPLPFIALRVRHAGQAVAPITGDTTLITTDTSMTGDGGYIAFSVAWRVADRTLTLTRLEGSAVTGTVVYDLTKHTIASLADAISSDGFAIAVEASPAQGVLSALILVDGAGDSASSNGDALFGFTSLLFAYLQPMAAELEAAEGQIGNMLLQMETQTAETEWLDFIGSYYAVPRVMAPCVNLLIFSNDLSQAPLPWAYVRTTPTRTAGGWKITPSTANDSHAWRQNLTLPNIAYVHTVTWRMRPAGYNAVKMQIGDNGANAAAASFDMRTGVASAITYGTGIPGAASMTLDADGWWLCRLTGLPAAAGTTLRMMLFVWDDALAENFAGDGYSGVEVKEFQLEQGDQPTPYVPSGTLTPEEDRAYGRRIIADVLRPRGNNVAISAAVKEATGQATSVEDVTLYGSPSPAYNSTYTHNSAVNHDAAAVPIYGLFDAETAYDLLGAEPPTLYIARVRDVVSRLRDAGTHLRSLTLGSGAITDAGPRPLGDTMSALALAPTLTDTVDPPTEDAGEALGDAAIVGMIDLHTEVKGDDSAGMELTVSYGMLHDGLRLYSGGVPHAGGAAPTETL